MRFPRILIAAIAVSLSGAWGHAGDAALQAELDAAKDTLNAAFETHDRATIVSMMTADHLSITTYYGRALQASDQLDGLDGFAVEEAAFSPSTVTLLAPTVALITYENTYKGTYAGKPLPPKVFVSEIWLKRDGEWLQGLYQETPIAPE
ncbi:MAG: nuclear transport factor 2 family protein [Hyphomicrobiales bacterium]|nr:nuclear transport factor 2 family protein [Hyphomicrobiales bacterium]